MLLDLQAVFREIGGFGAYQVLVCVVGFFTYGFCGTILSSGAFHNLVTCSDASDNGTLDEAVNASDYSSKHGFTTSVSVEYGLCGNRAALGELSAVFLLAGCIPGSLVAGPAADTLGRIPGLLSGLLCVLAANLLATLAPQFWLHLVSRLVCGFFVSWTLGCAFVYGNEVLMTEHRDRFVKLHNLGSAVACVLLALLAYICRDYKRLMIANNFLAIPSVLTAAFLPESPSWLLSQRSKSATQVRRALHRIARINRRPLPESVRSLGSSHPLLRDGQNAEQQLEAQADSEAAETPRNSRRAASLCAAVKKLLSDRVAVFQLLSTSLYSFSSGFAYFGFIFVITQALPNIFITFALMAAVEPPSLLLLNCFSRGRTLFVSAIVTVGCCLAISVIFSVVSTTDELSAAASLLMACLAVVGKFFSNIAFCAIMAVGAEIFPTAVRNTGLGLLMATLRSGCMASPLVNFIAFMPARFATLALPCLLAAFPMWSLPDTRVRDLTDTVGDLKAEEVAEECVGNSAS